MGKQANGEPPKGEVEGPVLAVLSKRLRNLKKRLRNADEIQAKRDSGKELNSDQELALSSKPGLLAAIDELEKMTSGLKEAVREEQAAAADEARQAALAEAEAAAARAEASRKSDAQWEAEREEAVAAAKAGAEKAAAEAQGKAVAAAVAEAVAKAKAEGEAAAAEAVAAAAAAAAAEARKAAVEETTNLLVDVMYLGTAFDNMSRNHILGGMALHDRAVALSYAMHFGQQLTEDDLSALVLLSHSLSLRIPLGAPLSHAEALQHCKELAGKLLARSAEPQTLPLGAPPVTPLTYAELADKLALVKGLAFFPLVPPYPMPHQIVQPPPSKPASPAPPPEEAAPPAPAPVAAAPAAAAAAPASSELPTAEQAAASGENLVGHFFGGAAAAAAAAPAAAGPAAPASEAAPAPAEAPAGAAPAAAAGEGEDARYPTVQQDDAGFAAPPAESVPQPLSFSGDKSLGISDASASGAPEGAAPPADGSRSGRGGGRGRGGDFVQRGGRGRGYGYGGRGRGEWAPRGGRGEGYGGRGEYGRGGGYRGRGEGYGGRSEGFRADGYGGRGGEGTFQPRGDGVWGRGRGRGRGGQPSSGGPAPAAVAPPQQLV